MNAPSWIAHAALLAVLMAGTMAMALKTRVEDTGRAGVTLVLPQSWGSWRGQEIRYCQNPDCQKINAREVFEAEAGCDACGSRLSNGSLVEWSLLPDDTRILKKVYEHPFKSSVLASIVLSGSSRTSIHRPQICLVGEGREIVSTRIVEVPIPGRDPMQVTMLEMLTRQQDGSGQWIKYASYYAYWFVSPDRETPHHGERMFWMAFDRVFRGVSHRWAYIAVSGQRQEGSEQHVEAAREFIAALQPELTNP
ncbi:MAG: exosortase-associated EpsI family protein [Kiritimatiellia bacterium]